MYNIIKDLWNTNRCLLSADYDSALKYIDHLIGLRIIEIPTGTKCGTWTVPQNWEVKDAWIKFNGKKIYSYKKDPLGLVVGSSNIKGTFTKEALIKHISYNKEMPKVRPYVMKYYNNGWGFSMPYNQFAKLKNGKYEVMVDTKKADGNLRIGEHVIVGKSNREVWVVVHLDHPYQANDGLSQVAMAIDLAKKIKSVYTIRILFVPETIGSIAYVNEMGTENLSFVITADMIGNDNSILLSKSFNPNDGISKAAQLALASTGKDFRITQWRAPLGADEYVFADPKINIPAVQFSRSPYKEYHTDQDTPDIIKKKNISEVRDIIIDTIKIMESDYIPLKNFKGPLMRSRFGVQSMDAETNRKLDYLIYGIDGKKSIMELAFLCALNYGFVYNLFKKLKDEDFIYNLSEGSKQ